jgi:hypothetical protein
MDLERSTATTENFPGMEKVSPLDFLFSTTRTQPGTISLSLTGKHM